MQPEKKHAPVNTHRHTHAEGYESHLQLSQKYPFLHYTPQQHITWQGSTISQQVDKQIHLEEKTHTGLNKVYRFNKRMQHMLLTYSEQSPYNPYSPIHQTF